MSLFVSRLDALWDTTESVLTEAGRFFEELMTAAAGAVHKRAAEERASRELEQLQEEHDKAARARDLFASQEADARARVARLEGSDLRGQVAQRQQYLRAELQEYLTTHASHQELIEVLLRLGLGRRNAQSCFILSKATPVNIRMRALDCPIGFSMGSYDCRTGNAEYRRR